MASAESRRAMLSSHTRLDLHSYSTKSQRALLGPEEKNKASTILSQFSEYKLSTEFCEGFYKHTIACEFGIETQKWNRDIDLGRGASGVVWLEKEEKQGALIVVKQISKAHILMNSRELLALITLKAFPRYFAQFYAWFENGENIYLTMEYIKYGNLGTFISRDNIPIPESDARTITVQILEGLRIMHENSFCHRDLKPQNILMVSLPPIVVKISDFGISKQEGDGTELRTNMGAFSYC